MAPGSFLVSAWVNDSGAGSAKATVEINVSSASPSPSSPYSGPDAGPLDIGIGVVVVAAVVLALFFVVRWRRRPSDDSAPGVPASPRAYPDERRDDGDSPVR